MLEIHNIEYVMATYGITIVAIGGYIALIWARNKKADSLAEELGREQG